MENRTSSRKTRVGLVVSDKMDKTVVVAIADRVAQAFISRSEKENITPGKARNIIFVHRYSEHRILSPKSSIDPFSDRAKRSGCLKMRIVRE